MDVADLTAEQLLAAYARLEISPVDALQAVSERIARDNADINAFAVLDPKALDAAGKSAQRWRAGNPIGPLDGVPCTVKDLIDIAGLPTRRGSRTTDTANALDDSPVVTSLKQAGAVVIGKTTTTEFGWKSPGDCPLHGITRNPRNRAYSTGGSSAGAAAAAAAGFAPLHVGTDAGGSIRIPAAWSGIVGLKPTFGRVPQWPLGAFSGVAVAGPMARTVRDAALMLNVLARPDARDPFCLPGPARDWRDGIEDGVDGFRVGILRRPGFDAPADAEALGAVETAARMLGEAGARAEQFAPDLPDAAELFVKLWSTALRLAVANTPPDRRPLLDHGLREVAALPALSGTELMHATALQNQAAHTMARVHLDYDLILCPTVPGPPPLAEARLHDPARALIERWAPWTFLFNLTRQPAISVPIGPGADALPRSVQLAAAIYRDDLVLRAARVLEAAQETPITDRSPAPRAHPSAPCG